MITFDREGIPWVVWIVAFPLAILLSPIGTIILTAWLELDFFGCCKLIGMQAIVFLTLAMFSSIGDDD